MVRRALTSAALLLSACSTGPGPDDADATGGAGGKADEVRACADGQTCLQFRSYEVLFTNPVCKTYPYDEPIPEVDGERDITTKPKNVFCRKKHDAEASANRDTSPQTRMTEWIRSAGDGDHVFAAYLSFSDEAVVEAMCDALGNGAEVTMVLDSSKVSDQAIAVKNCGGDVQFRGHVGSVGFAHNKFLMINPEDPGPADDDDAFGKISFGSGNASSGTHLSHENWHFIDVSRDSHFWQYHICLMEALVDESRTQGKSPFKTFMKQCRADIEAPEEDDMHVFMIPALDDSKALVSEMEELIEDAETIDIAAHRFSERHMIDGLVARLKNANKGVHVRLIGDDDMYWRTPIKPSKFTEIGFNSPGDAKALNEVREGDEDSKGDRRGRFEEAYLESNHGDGLFQHNKFLIFGGLDGRPDTLLMGSANLTGTGFKDNLENQYITTIPQVVQAFQAQYALWWDGEGPLPEGHDVAPRATKGDDMPLVFELPGDPIDGPSTEPGACGLRIAEVLYDAVNSDDGKEWIKLYNSCDEAVSMDGMSLGWGGSSYRTGGLDLEGKVEGKSCIVIGGPESESRNGSPTIDIEANFSPDLQNSGSTADGVALFATGRDGVTTTSVPVDAVIYGGSNSSQLLDSTGTAPDPHVGDAGSGNSILRVAADRWEIADPDPSGCPDF